MYVLRKKIFPKYCLHNPFFFYYSSTLLFSLSHSYLENKCNHAVSGQGSFNSMYVKCAFSSNSCKQIPKVKYKQNNHTWYFQNSLSFQKFSVQWICWTASGCHLISNCKWHYLPQSFLPQVYISFSFQGHHLTKEITDLLFFFFFLSSDTADFIKSLFFLKEWKK